MSNYTTTEDLKKTATEVGLKVVDKNFKVSFFENGDHLATVSKTDPCSFWIIAEWADAKTAIPLSNAILNYIKTPVDKREHGVYKLKVESTDMYLVYINEYETTVTTNKKAAKAYDSAGVYDAKVLAEKQGFALRAEVVDATN